MHKNASIILYTQNGGIKKMHKHLFLIATMCSVTACTKTTMSSDVAPAYPRAPQVTPHMQAYEGSAAQPAPITASPKQSNTSPANDAEPAYMYESERDNQLHQALQQVQDRMERLERAMVRLDRRMQLLERRELGRMSGRMQEDDTMAPAAGGTSASWQQSHMGNTPAEQAMPPMHQSQYGQGMIPMSQAITSPLQAAAREQGRTSQKSNSVKATGLPSLAEKDKQSMPASEMAVWTIEYEGGEIWPAREALADSREVVQTLRENDGKVTLFARGGDVRSRAFRERVRAVSRYLSKVSSIESVPIATMEAQHMTADTIEIFATR